jgi:NTE family protein
MTGLLEAKGVRTFGDLVRRPEAELRYRYKLQVIASDLTEERLLVLPRDAHWLGLDDPDELSVALAVRMSMSIPIFFEPVSFTNPKTGRDHLIVDGGMLSNFPVWLFDAEAPSWPTIGVRFIEDDPRAPLATSRVRGGLFKLVDYARSLVETMMEAHDRFYIEETDFHRTIVIDSLSVKTTEFDLSGERARAVRFRARCRREVPGQRLGRIHGRRKTTEQGPCPSRAVIRGTLLAQTCQSRTSGFCSCEWPGWRSCSGWEWRLCSC